MTTWSRSTWYAASVVRSWATIDRGWLNPTRRETGAGGRGAEYEVLFYLAREPVPGRAITDNLLTPVILHNDKVVSIGRYPLKKLRRSGCLSRSGPEACP